MRQRHMNGTQLRQQTQAQSNAQAHAQPLPPPVYSENPLTRSANLRENASLDSAPEQAAVVLLHRGAVLCHQRNEDGGAAATLQADASETQPGHGASAAAAEPVGAFAGTIAASDLADKAHLRIAACTPRAAQHAGLEAQLPVAVLGSSATGTLWLAAEVADADAAMQAHQPAQDGRLGDPEAAAAGTGSPAQDDKQCAHDLTWVDVRKAGASLCATDSAVAATAVGLIAWHRGNRFSAATGASTGVERGGWAVRGDNAGERCAAPVRCTAETTAQAHSC